MAIDRIQKILARAGLASRREAESWIADGLVTVNGQVVKLGDRADPAKDHIKVKGKLLQPSFEPLYYLFHKPRGVISMVNEDASGRPTIRSFLPPYARKVFPVGRLQFNEEGLVLLTNDGDFAEALLKARSVPRIYDVKVSGLPTREKIEGLLAGSRIEGKRVAPFSVRVREWYAKGASLELVFQGAGAVDLKTLFLRKGLSIEKTRLRAIGQLTVERVAPGKCLKLKRSQVEALISQPELGLRGIQQGLVWREPRHAERDEDDEAPLTERPTRRPPRARAR